MAITYKLSEAFTKTPGGRFKKHGPYSGEQFRDDILQTLLNEAILSNDELIIILDGTDGYGSSFLEEAFGGLIRLQLFDKQTVMQHLKVKAIDPLYETYKLSAESYMAAACPR